MLDRERFLTFLLDQVTARAPYIWRGKGLFLSDDVRGLVRHDFRGAEKQLLNVWDCSGLWTGGLHAVGGPDWRASHNAQSLYDVLEPTSGPDDPRPGDPCFYGPSRTEVTHVMTLWRDRIQVVGACGGNSSTGSLELASKAGAYARFRPHCRYRTNFLGFRRFPENLP